MSNLQQVEKDIEEQTLTVGSAAKIVAATIFCLTTFCATAAYVFHIDAKVDNAAEKIIAIQNQNDEQEAKIINATQVENTNTAILERLEKKLDSIQEKMDNKK